MMSLVYKKNEEIVGLTLFIATRPIKETMYLNFSIYKQRTKCRHYEKLLLFKICL